MTSVVTRFAPSPTGFLHIGGARTALFNALLARRFGGRYLLRIEDTDRARSTQAAIDAIIEGLDWLGLGPDSEVVYQFARAERHRECAEAMVAAGTAFRCYVTQEELAERRERGEALRVAAKDEAAGSEAERAAMRAEAAALLAPFRSPWRDGGAPPSPDAPYVIRLRAPDSGTITVSDHVQGEISIQADEIDDLILLRADGTPTYMLAVVVDDHDMGITHVVRGDDHFRNTFRQLPIYMANGWAVPEFAHVPLIHGPDGAKLSKRHGALGIEAYKDMGYLPEALCNYLLRLGWSHGDAEILSMDEAAAVFSLDGINKAPARLDFDKLASVNAHYMRAADPSRLAALVMPHLKARFTLNSYEIERIERAVPEMRERAQTVVALAEAMEFLVRPRPFLLERKAAKSLKPESLPILHETLAALQVLPDWNADGIKAVLEKVAQENGIGFGMIGAPMRACLTGGAPAPDLAVVMEWLGRDETLGRVRDQIVD